MYIPPEMIICKLGTNWKCQRDHQDDVGTMKLLQPVLCNQCYVTGYS